MTKNPLQWQLVTNAVATVRKGKPSDSIGLFATCVPSPQGWLLVMGESKSNEVDGFLESHSHKNLGSFKTLDAAMDAAQAFARKWLQSTKKDPKCSCKDIEC